MKIIQTLLLSISLSFAANASIEMTSVEPIKEHITIDVPKGFTLMSDNMLKRKYPSENRPKIVYTNESGTVNIAVNHTQMPLDDSKLDGLKDFMLESMKNYQPQAKEVMVDNKKAYILDFISHATDTDIHNLMLITPYKGTVLFVTFNTTKEEEATYLEAGKSSLMSIKFK
ncbi:MULTISPECIES: hypothetical protein [Limnobaculum]|nr:MULTISPECIES: hypothetical protein [Limnobaculum]